MVGHKIWYVGEWWRVYGLADGMAYCYAILNPDRHMTIPARYL
jgi:hypothetical protein